MNAPDPAAPPTRTAPSGATAPQDRTARHLAATLRTWGIAILLAGLVAAGLIYAFAPDATGGDLANQVAQGRMYRHNLELMGGTTAVLIDDFDRWFFGLWHGKSLAATVAVIALGAGIACLAAARIATVADGEERQRPGE